LSDSRQIKGTLVNRDIRHTPLFNEARLAVERYLMPGSGMIVDAQDIHARADGGIAVFAGVLVDKVVGTPPTRICTVDIATGEILIRTHDSGSHRLPRFAPDGETIAFLSDSASAGSFQLKLLDTETWITRSGPSVDGFVESHEWHDSGLQLLMVAAGVGADLAGAQGGFNPTVAKEPAPEWAPDLDIGQRDSHWRRAWVVDLSAHVARVVSPIGHNVWEAAWCGQNALIAIASETPDEGSWYRSRVQRIELETGRARLLYEPKHQIGWLCASPSGAYAAVVEAICSDRTVVAGDIVLIDVASNSARRLAADGVDVSALRFLDEHRLMFAGHRSFQTVLGIVNVSSGEVRVIWVSEALTFGGLRYPELAPLPGDRVIGLVEGFTQQPILAILGGDGKRDLATLANRALSDEIARLAEAASPLRWLAPDGLEIHGWLIVPKGNADPRPLTMEIHGGPVWQWRQRWLGRNVVRTMLIARGHAIFLPNPRGSSGRGQNYAAQVFGDMGGADTQDYLSCIDGLVAQGIADPRRLYVWGGSYGGFMSSWLVTQDQRFAAAVPVSPVTNWYSEHFTCHIPLFCQLFLGDNLGAPSSKYFTRSPVFFAARVRTPVLNITGAMDRNTPPGQAMEFHHALLEQGKASALLTYPKEGHGVRTYPAMFDFAARVVGWFEQHVRDAPAGG
jgi:dipeptidyl aminopeptidase/acylaminoacyl peptidase